MKTVFDDQVLERAKSALLHSLPEGVVLSYYEAECAIKAVLGATGSTYEKSVLAEEAERDLRRVQAFASEQRERMPTAWLHVYNLLIECDRAYMRGKFAGRAEADEHAKTAALPVVPWHPFRDDTSGDDVCADCGEGRNSHAQGGNE